MTTTNAALPTSAHLAYDLARLCDGLVPGASVAVTDGSDVATAAWGVASLRTQQPVTADTIFQIGSITKVYTATLVMQLVDAGQLELDDPVQRHLPWFRVADPHVSAAVTIRDLLRHTGGFEGDDFTDTGRGDDALRLFVEHLADAPQIHALGEMFSYCNSGYSVLGVLVEELTGTSWDQAVQARIAEPLGLTLGTLAEQVVLHPHAVGHVNSQAAAAGRRGWHVAPVWSPSRSGGPAGTVCSTARDLLLFGAAHVAAAGSGSGPRLLSAAAAGAMHDEQVLLPERWTLGRAWGLGWMLPVPGVIGHDGATYGQSAYYRLHPATGAAVALLTNGPGAQSAFDELMRSLFEPLAGVTVPDPATPPAAAAALPDASRYVGAYGNKEFRVEVARVDSGLHVAVLPQGDLSALAAVPPPQLFVPLEQDAFISAEPGGPGGVHVVVRFLGADDRGRARWLHGSGRATRRLGP